jgi:hypothetical protein
MRNLFIERITEMSHVPKTLSDFLIAERVKTTDGTLFHVKDCQNGLWGLFDVNRGLIISCTSKEKPIKASYGFWNITNDDAHHLFNPDTKLRTPATHGEIHQINQDLVIVSHEGHTYLIDFGELGIYGEDINSWKELKALGFCPFYTPLPILEGKFCFNVLVHNKTLILTFFSTVNSVGEVFVIDMKTGKDLSPQYSSKQM